MPPLKDQSSQAVEILDTTPCELVSISYGSMEEGFQFDNYEDDEDERNEFKRTAAPGKKRWEFYNVLWIKRGGWCCS